MAIGDIFKLSVVGIGPGNQELVNTFHYRQGGVLVLDEPVDDLLQAWQDDVQGSYLGTFTSGALIAKLEGRGITDPTVGNDFIYPEPRPVGEITGDSLPPQSAAIITWRTGLIGRSFRGRTYLWPAGESSQVGGNISAGYASAMQDFIDVAISIPVTVGHTSWQLGVLSTETDGAPREEPLFTPVTSGQIQAIIGTQRRRRVGVGA